MADGSHIVAIDGVNYRAFTAEKVEEFANHKDELAVCKDNEKRFTDKIAIADRDVTIANQQTAIEHGNFVRVMSLYERERELRTETMQFIPHGQVGGFGGKVLRFLDGPYGQSLFKLVIPTAQAIKVFSQ